MNILNKTQGVAAFTAKKLLSVLAMSAGLMTVSVAAADDAGRYDNLSKQLAIMNNIFTSSLQAQDDRKFRGTKVASTYLAGQGVIFTVSSANLFMWRQGFDFVMSDIVAPVAPVPPEGADVNFEYFTHDENIVIQIESAQEEHEQNQEHYRDLRNQQRDLAHQLRDIERENKDLAYQRRNADKEQQASLKSTQRELEKQKIALTKSQKTLEKSSKQIQVQQQKKQAKRQEQRSEQFALLTSSLMETLCTYGNSLKALPKSEHVSVLFKSAGDKTARSGYKDEIYVFNKKDIAACANDSITSSKLSSKAIRYQF